MKNGIKLVSLAIADFRIHLFAIHKIYIPKHSITPKTKNSNNSQF